MFHRLHGLFTDGIRSKNYKNYFFRNKNTLRYKNYKKSIVIFWFAHKGNPLPGEQNQIGFFKDNYHQ